MGLSRPSVGTPSISLITSMPSTTLPKTGCFDGVGSTNWQAPPPSVELGKPEPAPGHWRPADEMQTQTPV